MTSRHCLAALAPAFLQNGVDTLLTRGGTKALQKAIEGGSRHPILRTGDLAISEKPRNIAAMAPFAPPKNSVSVPDGDQRAGY